MSFADRNLKPTRKYAPHDVIGTFRTNYTGDAGYLVKVVSNDLDDDTYWSQTKIGKSYDGVFNNLFVSPKVVGKASAGDPAASLLGLTIEGTASEDAHGNKVNGFGPAERWAQENQYVPTGKPAQIVTEGIFEFALTQINGVPAPGSGVIAANDGKLQVVDPDNLVVTETGKLLVGKCLSTSGTRQASAEIYIKL